MSSLCFPLLPFNLFSVFFTITRLLLPFLYCFIFVFPYFLISDLIYPIFFYDILSNLFLQAKSLLLITEKKYFLFFVKMLFI